jgi:predicted transcriptional regulator
MVKEKYAKVTWKDIAGIKDNNCSWFNLVHAKEVGQTYFDYDYVTVGVIIENNKKYILIAATIDKNGDYTTYADISMIPKSVITKIQYIK